MLKADLQELWRIESGSVIIVADVESGPGRVVADVESRPGRVVADVESELEELWRI